MTDGKLVLIDGHALAYRAYHALPQDLRTARGEPTNAIYGFTSMLLNVLRDEQPEYIAVTFDVGRTFRHDAYAGYKAHRVSMPDDLSYQIGRIYEVLQAFNIPIYAVPGYEADDVLGALARQAEEAGLDVLIVTGDTDALQLVGPHTRVLTSRWRFSDTVTYDLAGVEERYGLKPEQLVDLKALIGDKSDNIPGVSGIGEKTATQLLQKYGSLENIYAHLDEITPARYRSALEQGRDSAFLSQRLATIRRDAPVQLDLDNCRIKAYDPERVTALLRELEFRSLAERLPGLWSPAAAGTQLSLFGAADQEEGKAAAPETGAAAESQAVEYQLIADEDGLRALAARLAEAPAIAVDVETTSTDAMMAELVGIALTDAPGRGYYVPISHPTTASGTGPRGEAAPPVSLWDINRADDERRTRNDGDPTPASRPAVPLETALAILKPVFENAAIAKYAHNAKYDLAVLAEHKAVLKGLEFDTMIAEWLINPERGNLGLKNLAWARLGQEMTPITDLIGTGKGKAPQLSMRDVPIERVAQYAGADVDMTFRLVAVLRPELSRLKLERLFHEVEMPLIPVLVDMERAGVKLDVAHLARMSQELEERLRALERQIQESVGYAFNINSTQQLSDVLFGRLGLPAVGLRKTQSGHYSTAAEVLEKLRGKHEVVDLVLEHRQLSKLKGTYVDALPALINPRTGRVHTDFNQTGAVTGRLSSSNPNLQNIPIRTEVGRQVRRAFIAEEGCKLVSADYSQVELRILAHAAHEPALLAAFHRGEDIHAATAAAVLGIPLDQVTPEQRRLAKTINFGVIYGISGYGLADRTELSPEEAERFINAYFVRYPRVQAYLEGLKRQAAEQGYVETLLGRRRYFPELAPGAQTPFNARRASERMAVNAPIQGTAADIIKIAMCRLHSALQERGLRSRMILQVHDELVLEAPDDEVETVKPLIVEIMEGAYQLDAPLKADVKVGLNWDEMT